MDLHYYSFCFLLLLLLLLCLNKVAFSDQDGFLSLSCGGTSSFVDSSNISWVSDSDYVILGNTTIVDYIEGTSSSSVPVRFFPDTRKRKCYSLPLSNVSSLVLVRTQFVYRNYDGLAKPPAFSVSLGTAITTFVNLTSKDPWVEEFMWPVKKDILRLCLISIPNGGSPTISSIEVRPLPQGAYNNGIDDFTNKSLRKCYRINCGSTNGSLRFEASYFSLPFHFWKMAYLTSVHSCFLQITSNSKRAIFVAN